MKVWKREDLVDYNIPALESLEVGGRWVWISPTQSNSAETVATDNSDEEYETIIWHGKKYQVHGIDLDYEMVRGS